MPHLDRPSDGSLVQNLCGQAGGRECVVRSYDGWITNGTSKALQASVLLCCEQQEDTEEKK